MKHFIFVVFFLMALTHVAQNTELELITVNGFYSGKNLLIKNQFCSGKDEIGFLINTIKVNGNYTTAEINSEHFEIPLDEHKLIIGEPVKLEIWHKKACTPINKPFLMNPGALLSAENMVNKTENHIILNGTFAYATILIINSNNCIKEVKLNGKAFETNTNKDFVEINLAPLGAIGDKPGYMPGDKISIELICNKNGQPIILNPEYLHYEDK